MSVWLAVAAAWAAVVVSIITARLTLNINRKNLQHARETELRQRQNDLYDDILSHVAEVGTITGPFGDVANDLDPPKLLQTANSLYFRASALGVPLNVQDAMLLWHQASFNAMRIRAATGRDLTPQVQAVDVYLTAVIGSVVRPVPPGFAKAEAEAKHEAKQLEEEATKVTKKENGIP